MVIRGQMWRRRLVVAVTAAMGLLLQTTGSTLAADPTYGGYQTTGNWNGINGYLRQTTTASTSGAHFQWINVCAHNDCTHWVQVGTYQGSFRGGTSSAAVHVYYENVDACGDYYAGDKGAPPSADFPYGLAWNGQASSNISCNNGDHHTGFTFKYTKGGVSNTPFFYGTLPTKDGIIGAKTEMQSALESTDWFGCNASGGCTTSLYGLHLLNGATWSLQTANSVASTSNPPFLHTYNSFWSYKTCATAC
jgi:hypothetical protein